MPVPRCAPYVAIGMWPGARANSHRAVPPTPPAKDGRVSFLDAAHSLELEPYQRTWASTTAAVRELMVWPPDKASLYRDVAFVLSTSAVDALDFDR